MLFTYFCTCNLQIFSRSCGSALRVLLSYLQFAIRSHASGNALHALLVYSKLASSSRTTFLKTCDFLNRSCRKFHFAYYFCTCNLRFRSRASRIAFCVLLWYLRLAPEAGAAGARFAYLNLGISCRSCGSALRVLLLCLEVAILQPELWVCSSRATFVIKIAVFKPELPRTKQGEPETTRDRESRRANHETTSKHRFASKESRKTERRHSKSASTRRVSAEGSPSSRQITARRIP